MNMRHAHLFLAAVFAAMPGLTYAFDGELPAQVSGPLGEALERYREAQSKAPDNPKDLGPALVRMGMRDGGNWWCAKDGSRKAFTLALCAEIDYRNVAAGQFQLRAYTEHGNGTVMAYAVILKDGSMRPSSPEFVSAKEAFAYLSSSGRTLILSKFVAEHPPLRDWVRTLEREQARYQGDRPRLAAALARRGFSDHGSSFFRPLNGGQITIEPTWMFDHLEIVLTINDPVSKRVKSNARFPSIAAFWDSTGQLLQLDELIADLAR